MALAQPRVWTMDDFMEFVERPENSDRLFELINGEIIEKKPGTTSLSGLSLHLGSLIYSFCKAHDLSCRVSGGDGAYDINGYVIAPDLAFKTAPMSDEYADPLPPLWVVEIIAPTENAYHIRAKKLIYLAAKILYWEIYPKSQSVDIYAPGQPVRTVESGGTLDVSDLPPGLTIPASELFSDNKNQI